jgi:hypothetical protein
MYSPVRYGFSQKDLKGGKSLEWHKKIKCQISQHFIIVTQKVKNNFLNAIRTFGLLFSILL